MVQWYAAQIVLALEYLQQQNVAHRDLKPDNIMISNNKYIKIIDFGEAKIVDNYETASNLSHF
jgi:protein kinase A